MRVICGHCYKKYEVDGKEIKGAKAQFTCTECGHVTVFSNPSFSPVEEPLAETFSSGELRAGTVSDTEKRREDGAFPAEEEHHSQVAPESQRASAGGGVPLFVYVSLFLLIGAGTIVAAGVVLYLKIIPGILSEQINFRAKAVASALASSIEEPLLLHNYLQVNKGAKRISKISGVAYVAVINERGLPIAGFFGDLRRFDSSFSDTVSSKGFPKDVVAMNPLQAGSSERSVRIKVGGQEVVDHCIAIGKSGNQVRIGVFVSEVTEGIKNVLLSRTSFIVVGIYILVGVVLLLLLVKSLVRPVKELTENARRISVGQLDLKITPRGPREMRELARAFARMQSSIQSMLERMQ